MARSDEKLDQEEATDEQNSECQRQEVEVLVDEPRDGLAEVIDEARHDEEAQASAEHRCDHEDREADREDPRREGEDLVGDGGQAGQEDRPEDLRN